jgi:hypothetical protein
MIKSFQTKSVFALISVIGLLIYICNIYINIDNELNISKRYIAQLSNAPNYVCASRNTTSSITTNADYNRRPNQTALIVTTYATNDLNNQILKVFDSMRFKYKVLKYNSKLDFGIYFRKNKLYAVLIFENNDDFGDLEEKQRHDIYEYCRLNRVGVLFFAKRQTSSDVHFKECRLCVKQNENFFFITKPNEDRIVVNKIVKYSNINQGSDKRVVLNCNQNLPIIAMENEEFPKVYIGLDLSDIWILKLIFLDSLVFASNQRMIVSLKRFIQIDIDDVFVGASGTRMKIDDVRAFVDLQDELATSYFKKSLLKNRTNNGMMTNHSFKFNLGYSGHFFKSGNPNENEADELLIGKLCK